MSGSNRAAAGIGVSRVLGLVREILIGATLGVTPAAEAFRVAMRIPNIVQNLLGEGSLSASFVPVYARLIEDRQETEARRVAGGVLGLLTAAIVIIVALIVLFAGPIISVLAWGIADDATRDKAVDLTRITAVGIGLLGISAWCLGILNSHRQYFLSYAAPALWNLAQIVTLAIAALIFAFADTDGETEEQTASRILDNADRAATWLAVAVLVGSFLQLAVQVPRVRVLTQGVTPHLRRDGDVRTVLRRFGPAVGARGVVQISSFLDIFLATFLVQGGLATLGLVTPLYILPISFFGFSIAATELTEMSRRSDRADHVARRVEIGLRKVALPAGLVTGLLVFGGGAIADTLFRWPSQLLDGSISADNSVVFGLTMAVYALALPAAMSARVTQNALFALGDTATPARIAIVRLIVLLAITVLVMFQADRLTVVDGAIGGWDALPHFPPWEPLDVATRKNLTGVAHLGPVGIGLGTLGASWVEWALLRRNLNRAIGQHTRSGLAVATVAAGLGTGVVVLAIRVLLNIPMPLEGIVLGIAALGSYIGLLRFQGYRPLGPVGANAD